MTDKMTMDDVIEELKAREKRLVDSNLFELASGYNASLKFITDNRQALERGMRGELRFKLEPDNKTSYCGETDLWKTSLVGVNNYSDPPEKIYYEIADAMNDRDTAMLFSNNLAEFVGLTATFEGDDQ